MEQNTLRMINQPLKIDWQTARVSNPRLCQEILKQNRRFRLLYEDDKRASFLWLSYNHQSQYQWGYVIIEIEKEQIMITTIPGKDLEKFIRDIRRTLKSADIVVAFRLADHGLLTLKELEYQMIADLAQFFNTNPDLSLVLLRQDELGDADLEWAQGIFILKLGTLLMEYLDQHRGQKPQ